MYNELVRCSFVENDTILRIQVQYHNKIKYINIRLSDEMGRLLKVEKKDDIWSSYSDPELTIYDIKIKKPKPITHYTQTVAVPSCESSNLAIGYTDIRLFTLPKQF